MCGVAILLIVMLIYKYKINGTTLAHVHNS